MADKGGFCGLHKYQEAEAKAESSSKLMQEKEEAIDIEREKSQKKLQE